MNQSINTQTQYTIQNRYTAFRYETKGNVHSHTHSSLRSAGYDVPG